MATSVRDQFAAGAQRAPASLPQFATFCILKSEPLSYIAALVSLPFDRACLNPKNAETETLLESADHSKTWSSSIEAVTPSNRSITDAAFSLCDLSRMRAVFQRKE
jgi:hypothetical protein